MNKLLLVILLVIHLGFHAFSQLSGNELIIANDTVDEYFGSLSRVNEEIFCLYSSQYDVGPPAQFQSRLLKLYLNGDTVWLDFAKQDSIIHFLDMIVNNIGNLVLVGNIYIEQNGTEIKKQWFCEVTPDLSIIWENGVYCEHDSVYTYNSRIGQSYNGSYIYVANMRDKQTFEPYMYSVNISSTGDSISYHHFDLSVTGRINSITSSENCNTLHLVHSDFGSPYHCKLFMIDSNFNTLSFIPYPIYTYNDPFYTIKGFSENSYISFGRYWFLGEYYLKAIVFDTTNGVHLNNNYTSGEDYVYPAWAQGIDYYYDNLIFVTGMFNVQSMWPDFPNEFYIACLNGELNLVHEEILGGDFYYNIDNISATSDGGVVVAGSIYDPGSNSYQQDAYLIRIDSLFFVGQNENNNISPITRLEIFPNPGHNILNLKMGENISHVEIFNTTGQIVHSVLINSKDYQVNVSNWPSGIYFIKRIAPQSQILLNKFVKL
jgi:hypothetical protein